MTFKNSGNKATRHLRFETMESRRLLSTTPQMLGDINSSPAGSSSVDDHNHGSVDVAYIEHDDALLFTPSNSLYGKELWRSDGTEDGTHLLKDLAPGLKSSSPGDFVEFNNVLFFIAADPAETYGRTVWQTDGTSEGTSRFSPSISNVLDIAATPDVLFIAGWDGLWKYDGATITQLSDVSGARTITFVGDRLFFKAEGDDEDLLWTSDGTTVGTFQVSDDVPLYGVNATLQVVGNLLFFVKGGGNEDGDLWVTNGTLEETRLVLSGFGRPFTGNALGAQISGSLYVVTEEFRFWKTDGTYDGTVRVSELEFELISSDRPHLLAVEGKLYIDGDSAGLWRFDPTTRELNSIDQQTWWQVANSFAGPSEGLYYTDTEGALWTADRDGQNSVKLSESGSSFARLGDHLLFGGEDQNLWKTDGSIEGTVRIHDVVVGDKFPGALHRNGDTVYFHGEGSEGAGIELWKTDGTTEGTALIKDIHLGTANSQLTGFGYEPGFVAVNGRVVFAATDGTHSREPWVHDPKTNEATMLMDIILEGEFGCSFEHPEASLVGDSRFFSNGQHVLFEACGGLWETDGTIDGTGEFVGDIGEDAGQRVYFAGRHRYQSITGDNDGFGTEAYRLSKNQSGSFSLLESLAFDGHLALLESEGIQIIGSNGESFRMDGSIYNAVVFKDRLYYAADSVRGGSELFVSDGTENGTGQLFDGSADALPSNLVQFVVFKDHLFFVASNEEFGREIWRTDGTSEGTHVFVDIEEGAASSSPGSLRVAGESLYFTTNSVAEGNDLWRSDGTVDGTERIEIVSSRRWSLTLGDELLFWEIDDEDRESLWRTAGASGDVQLIAEIENGPDLDALWYASPARANGTLYFSADDGIHGEELWQSDGTTEGTRLVFDIYPGETGSYPTGLRGIDGQLYFTANDGIHGYEPWVLDPANPIVGDANGDGLVDVEDLNILAVNWRQVALGSGNGDFSGDGVIDAKDLNLLGLNWQPRSVDPVPLIAMAEFTRARQTPRTSLAVPVVKEAKTGTESVDRLGVEVAMKAQRVLRSRFTSMRRSR